MLIYLNIIISFICSCSSYFSSSSFCPGFIVITIIASGAFAGASGGGAGAFSGGVTTFNFFDFAFAFGAPLIFFERFFGVACLSLALPRRRHLRRHPHPRRPRDLFRVRRRGPHRQSLFRRGRPHHRHRLRVAFSVFKR